MKETEIKGTLQDFAISIQAQLLIALWGNSNEEERKEIKPKIEALRELMKDRIPTLIEMNPDSEEIGELARDFRARENN